MLVQVFRCLAGLWSIDTGSITKPGGGKALALAAVMENRGQIVLHDVDEKRNGCD